MDERGLRHRVWIDPPVESGLDCLRCAPRSVCARRPIGVASLHGSAQVGDALIVRQPSLVLGLHERRRHEKIGRGAVARHRDVPDDRDAEQRLHVWVVRLRLERIPEEAQDVDRAIDDPGADLLIPAEGTAAEGRYGETQLVPEETPGVPGRVKGVPSEQVAVERRSVQQIPFLVVVGDQGDALDVGHLASHCGCHVHPSAASRLSRPCCASTTLESRLPEGSSFGWAPDYPAFDEFVTTFAWMSRPAFQTPLGAVRRT